MIISYILGGIGNQMFQYAAGRALSLSTGQSHLLDVSDFSGYALHNGYELDRVFNVAGERADVQVVRDMLGWKARPLGKRLLRRQEFAWLRGEQFVVEPYSHYWPDFSKLTCDCYLFGYWQSERYFKSAEVQLRKEFIFREPLSGRNSVLAAEISACQSVSVHIRRGDYVNDPKTRAILCTCSEDYYLRAINYIAGQVNHPVFYIFSDDVGWAKQRLQISYPSVFVDHNFRAESYRDMQLMSLCHHHIIANSSFSWWGAWLNGKPGKRVVAPLTWFCGGADARDLIPSEWLRL